jgi:hypothetical protein
MALVILDQGEEHLMSSTTVEQDKSLKAKAAGVVTVPMTELNAAPAGASTAATHTPWSVPAPHVPPQHEIDRPETRAVFAVFCYEDPDSFIGRYVGQTVAALAENGTPIHLFTRRPFPAEEPGVRTHEVGDCSEDDLLGSVQDFTRRACNAFLRQFPGGAVGITLLGYEWSAVPSLSLLHAVRNFPAVASFHSLEWERSDMSGETSWRIAEIELAGLREARTIVVHRMSTAKIARRRLPECAGRIVEAHQFFPRGGPRN